MLLVNGALTMKKRQKSRNVCDILSHFSAKNDLFVSEYISTMSASVSLEVPNTEKLMKVRGSWVGRRGSCVVGRAPWAVRRGSCVVGCASWVVRRGSCVVGRALWVVSRGSWFEGSESWVVGCESA